MEDYWVCYAREACFGGRIKTRLEDFVVDEIGPDGKVVELTGDKGLPAEAGYVKKFQEWTKANRAAKKGGRKEAEVSEAVETAEVEPLAKLLGEAKAKEVEDFVARTKPASGATLPIPDAELKLGDMERDARVALNRSLRAAHPYLSVRTELGTVNVHYCTAYPACVAAFDEKFAWDIVDYAMSVHVRTHPTAAISAAYTTEDKAVKAAFYEAVQHKFGRLLVGAESGTVTLTKKQPKKKLGKEGVEQPYTQCVLQKTDLSWHEASRQLANKIRCHERDINCAGMKDKQGVTTQRISVRGVMARVLAQFWHDKLKVSTLTYSKEPVATGALAGNRFKIVVRDLLLDDGATDPPAKRQKREEGAPGAPQEDRRAALTGAVERVLHGGFFNSFGPQRFAYLDRDGVHIGLHLVRRDYIGAVTALMTPTAKDTEEIQAVKRAFLADRDAAKAAKALPAFKTNERDVLFAAARAPDTPSKWFSAVPYPAREFWLHTLQSWVWNEVLHRRREKFGEAVLEGDLIMPPFTTDRKTPDPLPAPVVCTNPAEHTLDSVVLPKPGGPPTTQFPAHPEMSAIYDEVLARHALPRHSWDLSEIGVKLAEKYRHVHVRPAGGRYELKADGAMELGFALPLSTYATVCVGAMLGHLVH